jgi:hypothetical protein
MKRTTRWTVIVTLAGLCAWLVVARRDDLLQALRPGFLVIEIRSPEKSMVLQRANHRYVVRCGESCGHFKSGKRYPMKIQNGALEYRRKGEKLALPILEEQIFFPTQPGGLG